jgi:colanic acid/amylovoran biosynthesis glycosyltransferase
MQPIRVAYILLHFPHLTETFVAEEIQALRLQGINVQIVSLLSPKLAPAQPLSEQLLPYTWYAPDLLSLSLWKAHYRFLFKSPCLYLRLLTHLLRQSYNARHFLTMLLKRLVIFAKAVAVAHHLEGSDVTLLHAHFARLPGAAAWIIARFLDLPFTVTVHAFEIYSYKNDLLNLVVSQADQVITISEHNRGQIAALTDCSTEAIQVIHCGVNLARLIGGRPQIHAKASRHDHLRILSVGSLVPKKGHTYLIAACNLLKERGLNFTCTIIGSGPQEPALSQQIKASDLQKHVKLLGAQPHPEIIKAYYQHDLFVLASVVAFGGDRDGIPVVLMEAGALNLPLISTQISGIPELVRHNETGLLVPSGDAEALADAITTLATNSELRFCLGQQASSLVRSEFDIDCNILRLAALLQNVCRGNLDDATRTTLGKKRDS